MFCAKPLRQPLNGCFDPGRVMRKRSQDHHLQTRILFGSRWARCAQKRRRPIWMPPLDRCVASRSLEIALRLCHLTPAVHARLGVDMVAQLELAGMLVFLIVGRSQPVVRSPAATSRPRYFLHWYSHLGPCLSSCSSPPKVAFCRVPQADPDSPRTLWSVTLKIKPCVKSRRIFEWPGRSLYKLNKALIL